MYELYDKSQSKEVLIILIYAVINLSAQIIIHLNENTPLPPNVTSVFKIFKVYKH